VLAGAVMAQVPIEAWTRGGGPPGQREKHAACGGGLLAEPSQFK